MAVGTEQLLVCYQPVVRVPCNESRIQVGVLYDGAWEKLQVQAFSEAAVGTNTYTQMKPKVYPSNVSRSSLSIVTISTEVLTANISTVIRIVATNGNEICSNTQSQQSFYWFSSDSTYESEKMIMYYFLHFNFITGFRERNATNGSVTLPVPTPSQCNHPLTIWPKNHTTHRQCTNYCICLPIEENYSFASCAEQCHTEFSPTLSENSDSITFNNIQANESFFVYFVCDRNPCYNATNPSSYCGITYIETAYNIFSGLAIIHHTHVATCHSKSVSIMLHMVISVECTFLKKQLDKWSNLRTSHQVNYVVSKLAYGGFSMND